MTLKPQPTTHTLEDFASAFSVPYTAGVAQPLHERPVPTEHEVRGRRSATRVEVLKHEIAHSGPPFD